jgi:cytochrome bd-type quinol oxidase subunit 2
MKWAWLQNPSVALIELVASAIAVVQSVGWLCRYIYRVLTEIENERYRRVRIATAMAALAVVVASSAVTWPVIMAEAMKDGDHGFFGVLDPLNFDLLAFLGAVTLLKDARARQRFSPFASCLLGVTLATVAAAYIFSSGPSSWIGAATTSSAPNLGIVALTGMFFQCLRRVGPEQTKEQQVHHVPPAGDLR